MKPACTKLDEFCEYLLNTYLLINSSYPPHVWTCHTSSLERTTNACESFHSRFKSSFYHLHPDVFLFVEALKSFQTDTYIQIQSIHTPHKVRNMYKRMKEHVQHFIDEYGRNKITRQEFLIRCGYYLWKPVPPIDQCPTSWILFANYSYSLTWFNRIRVPYSILYSLYLIICVQNTSYFFGRKLQCVQFTVPLQRLQFTRCAIYTRFWSRPLQVRAVYIRPLPLLCGFPKFKASW